MQTTPETTPLLDDLDAVADVVSQLTWPQDRRQDLLGLEVEAFPIWSRSGSVGGRVALGTVREIIERDPSPTPGRITLEPGGQLEYSTAPHADLPTVIDEVGAIWDHLESSFEESGSVLASVGVDPWHPVEAVPQQLEADRYVAMDRYFADTWPSGAVMMRNTCSLQVNVDAGHGRVRDERWTAANLMSPILTAMFATSPGVDGSKSRRAGIWQAIDSTRTGLPVWFSTDSIDPQRDTIERALSGNVMYVMRGDRCHRLRPGWTLRDWVMNGHDSLGPPTIDDVKTYLSTLFHEVRARNGTLEIRSIDALPRRWWSVPAAFVSVLLYDHEARGQVIDNMAAHAGDLDQLWHQAAARGLEDPVLCRSAEKLARLAIDAACRDDRIDSTSVAALENFTDRFTLRGQSPADELRVLADQPDEVLAWATGA